MYINQVHIQNHAILFFILNIENHGHFTHHMIYHIININSKNKIYSTLYLGNMNDYYRSTLTRQVYFRQIPIKPIRFYS